MRLARDERALFTDWWLTVDKTLLALIVLLAVAGGIASLVTSAEIAKLIKADPFYFAKRHAAALVAAIGVVIAASLMSPLWIRRAAFVLFAAGIVAMIAVLFVGVEKNGAARWLNVGVVVQPSEFVKPAFAVLAAFTLSESVRRPDMPALELSLAALALFVGLLVAQPDMGQAILVIVVWAGLFFLSGYSLGFLPLFAAAALGGLAAAYLSVPHFASRIDRFLGGAGDAHQTTVAANAFREAGWLGRGFGEGFVKARLPDAHNDYVFAAIAEELGIIACLCLVFIYAAIVWRAMRAAFRQANPFVRLTVAGLVMVFGFQALANMAVNLNLAPAKGVTLPFISYGRSSVLASAITLGMILGLTRRSLSFQGAGAHNAWGGLDEISDAQLPIAPATFIDTTALFKEERTEAAKAGAGPKVLTEEGNP